MIPSQEVTEGVVDAFNARCDWTVKPQVSAGINNLSGHVVKSTQTSYM